MKRHINVQLSGDMVDKLAKYSTSRELTIALLINKNRELTLGELILPNLNIAALWLFWAALPDQSLWCLYGNMMDKPKLTHFEYPNLNIRCFKNRFLRTAVKN
ncbi:MAG: hypothetical protein ACLPX5_06250, partial [Dissulfurispiraceae bacterium]